MLERLTAFFRALLAAPAKIIAKFASQSPAFAGPEARAGTVAASRHQGRYTQPMTAARRESATQKQRTKTSFGMKFVAAVVGITASMTAVVLTGG